MHPDFRPGANPIRNATNFRAPARSQHDSTASDTFPRWLRRLASPRLTLLLLAALAVPVSAILLADLAMTWALAGPLLLLAANLLAAIAVNPAFRRKRPLLLFHLALLAIVLLIALGRLTYLKGQAEVAEGQEFAGELTAVEAGPWHPFHLADVHFINDGFSIEYAPGLLRGETRNAVRYPDAAGRIQNAVIGDSTPLVIAGYRFYTTFNKGFAPVFLWQPTGGEAQLGAVHLPGYPRNEYRQAQEWMLPGTGIKVWIMLQFDEVILDPEKDTQFRLPERHKLVVRTGDQRRELQPGEAIELPEGRLVYDGLRTWMGYTVFYDWTLKWLLAACLVAACALGWHFWRKFAAQPWNP